MAGKAEYARIWRGRTARDRADEYQAYWLANGLGPLKKKGALSVEMLREDGGSETEFVTISRLESVEAMTGGKDEDPRAVHHLDRDPEFLLELPKRVQILRILAADA